MPRPGVTGAALPRTGPFAADPAGGAGAGPPALPASAPAAGQRSATTTDSLDRLLTADPGSLGVHELLYALLEPRLAPARAEAAAERLLRAFTAVDGTRGPLRRLGRASPGQLRAAGGIPTRAAARLVAALELGRRFAAEPLPGRSWIGSAVDVFHRLRPRLRDVESIESWVLAVNATGEVVHEAMICRAPDADEVVCPREVFRAALHPDVRGVIVARNDPDAFGLPRASPADRDAVARLAEAAWVLRIELRDYVLVGERGFLSFRETGLLWEDGAGRRQEAGRAAAVPEPGTAAAAADQEESVCGVDLGRLEAALRLHAYPLGAGRFEVAGDSTRHYVELAPGAEPACDCGASGQAGPGHCPHVLRVRLAAGDAAVLHALEVLATRLGDYADALEARLRPAPIRLTPALRARAALTVGRPEAALSFEHEQDAAGPRVRVLLARSGRLLGELVRQGQAIGFIAAARAEPLARAA